MTIFNLKCFTDLVYKPNFNKRKLVLIVFIIVKECGEILINCPNGSFGTKVNKTLEVC